MYSVLQHGLLVDGFTETLGVEWIMERPVVILTVGRHLGVLLERVTVVRRGPIRQRSELVNQRVIEIAYPD